MPGRGAWVLTRLGLSRITSGGPGFGSHIGKAMENSESGTAMGVLRAIAPEGHVGGPYQAFVDATAFLRTKQVSTRLARQLASQIERYAKENGSWELVGQELRLRLPGHPRPPQD
jgi:hypothetical protein